MNAHDNGGGSLARPLVSDMRRFSRTYSASERLRSAGLERPRATLSDGTPTREHRALCVALTGVGLFDAAKMPRCPGVAGPKLGLTSTQSQRERARPQCHQV